MDIQQLPALKGQRGCEYKIRVIQLRTRMKYSEMHPRASSTQVAAVLQRAVNRLPPFHLVVTDNAMVFTMAYTAPPDRRTTCERMVTRLGWRHGRIARRSPWQNGFIERSNRTDNDACFHQHTFRSAEERRYGQRLWEMHYNTHRPQQGLAGQTPVAVFRRDYPCHAGWRCALTL
jgi:transposase InsO family protein